MAEWLYTLRERFTPRLTESWDNYVAFSGFHHITELVSIDSMLCSNVIQTLRDEDWNYNIHQDCKVTLFRDGDYLKTRPPVLPDSQQVFAILQDPEVGEVVPLGYTQCGYDIIDSDCHISTLTNCGQMPEVFEPSVVNQFGLLAELSHAQSIRDKMRSLEPDDPHLGKCEVWQIARAFPFCG